MAKENGNGGLKWAGLLVTIIVLFTGLVTTWTIYGYTIKSNTESIVILNKDGSKAIPPLQERVRLLEWRMDEFSKEQRTIKTNTEEILKRLPK